MYGTVEELSYKPMSVKYTTHLLSHILVVIVERNLLIIRHVRFLLNRVSVSFLINALNIIYNSRWSITPSKGLCALSCTKMWSFVYFQTGFEPRSLSVRDPVPC
jgi:hypothetical protein